MSLWYESILDKGLLPDAVIRFGIRRLCAQRLQQETRTDFNEALNVKMRYVAKLKSQPIAIHTSDANEQHYEVPTSFYRLVLGKRLKYSSAYFVPGCTDLDAAEERMFDLYCERARIHDGMTILDLGCGWGSLSLFLAEKYPNARITGLSNSATQKEHIMSVAKEKGFKNIEIVTADINQATLDKKFDRILSIEMFEHMKNYELLLEKVSSWMKDDALLFIHIFSHKYVAYDFATDEDHSWMAQHFFTGGTMPSDDLLLYFQQHVSIVGHWFENGTHYGKTSECWLANTDKHSAEVLRIFAETYGEENAHKWLYRWRIFFMSCAELFNFDNGNQWGVSHYLFEKKKN